MRFAHLADCHIGSWTDPKMRELNRQSFLRSIDLCIERQLDFILIAGDLFNTSLPAIDQLKTAVQKLKELADRHIPCYVIAGSHDFSPSGKTMLEVLEEAGLCVNVAKASEEGGMLILGFTVDPKTGAKITGIPGRKGMLDRTYYEMLHRDSIENEKGYKIFMFHTAITEFKPKGLESVDAHPLSLLPKGFNYYAGGHVHYRFTRQEPGYGTIAFPGPIFPNNFQEVEELHSGGLNIVEDGKVEYVPVVVKPHRSITIDAELKSARAVEEEMMSGIRKGQFKGCLVTLRAAGTLSAGKPRDIDFKAVIDLLAEKGAYFVMKNTHKLASRDFDQVKVKASSIEEIEDRLISEHLNQVKADLPGDEKKVAIEFMHAFHIGKEEGERSADFEKRIIDAADRTLKG